MSPSNGDVAVENAYSVLPWCVENTGLISTMKLKGASWSSKVLQISTSLHAILLRVVNMSGQTRSVIRDGNQKVDFAIARSNHAATPAMYAQPLVRRCTSFLANTHTTMVMLYIESGRFSNLIFGSFVTCYRMNIARSHSKLDSVLRIYRYITWMTTWLHKFRFKSTNDLVQIIFIVPLSRREGRMEKWISCNTKLTLQTFRSPQGPIA
ncbi:uncharacterized protein CLUP02_13177 [Colletotrichum lupini]|uniref:Uncharacterized protein n=1 Tax=Colletotrichum lupini TaxID=145971 RepID=A0A9Q8T1Q6_9PEZI|nr:uncharacterized protein CLUP02_13177 [Colletotrichum lupini]UQC87659.1 hypothetical protein CLUP02_13177 [Colletotrichum lupini]